MDVVLFTFISKTIERENALESFLTNTSKMLGLYLVIEPVTSRNAVWCVTSRTPRQMNVTIELRLFKCVIVKGRHINSAKFAGHTFEQSRYFYNILIYKDSYIWQFLIQY